MLHFTHKNIFATDEDIFRNYELPDCSEFSFNSDTNEIWSILRKNSFFCF